jgi:hypothetical protein
MLLKSMAMERVLAESFPGKTLDEFLAQQRSEVEANVDNAKKAIVDTIMGVIAKAKAVKKRDAAGGNKFTAELKGGTVETFLGGVTGLVGEPHPETERGMAEEHLDKPDSHTAFTASNYPTSSTPAIEFAVVLGRRVWRTSHYGIRIDKGFDFAIGSLQEEAYSGPRGSDQHKQVSTVC